MIIIALYQNGVAEIVSPSRIFQGTDSEQIVVLSPYPYTVPLQISYTSPKGVNNGYVPMQPIDLPSDYTTVSAWQYSPGASWTQNYGTAYINLLVNLPTETSGTYGQLTTFMCQITIEQSILPTLPPTPTQDVYNQILEYLGAYADLNERINKLEQAEVTGVKGNAETTYRTGDVNITPANIGLGNVDNTSDEDKPVSTAQQEALNALQQEVESYADTAAENAQSAAVNTANKYTDGQISSLQTTLEDYTDTQVASGVTEAVQQAKEYTDDQFGIKVGTTVTVGGLAQATVDLDTAMVRGVIATQLTNQNIDTFFGSDYWGKVFFIPGGSSVTGLPPNVNGGTLEVLRGGGQTTVHRYTATTDTSGESISPNMLQRQYITSWSDWEEVVSADGNYPTLGAGYFANTFYISVGTTNLGWRKLGSINNSNVANTDNPSVMLLINGIYASQSATGAAESGIIEFEARRDAGTYAYSGINVLCGNLNATDFCTTIENEVVNIYMNLPSQYNSFKVTVLNQTVAASSKYADIFNFSNDYYGSTAPDGAVYAVLRNKASSAIADGNGNNIADTYATKKGTYSQMTVGNATDATNAANVTTKINGKAISSIFESDGVTVKNSTTVNGVNVYTSVSQLGLSGSYTDEDVVDAMSVPSVFIGYSIFGVNIYKFDTSGARSFLALCNDFAWASSFTLQHEFNWEVADTKYDDTVVVTEDPVDITSILYPMRQIAKWRLTFSDDVRITVPVTSDTQNCAPLIFVGFNSDKNYAIESGAITHSSQSSITIAAGQTLDVMGYYNPSGAWVLKFHCPDYFSVLEDAGVCALGVYGECRNPYSYKISAVVPQNETSASATVYIKQIS